MYGWKEFYIRPQCTSEDICINKTKMTHKTESEWVLLIDDDTSKTVVETIVDVNYQTSSSESGYTSEEAFADEILRGNVDCETGAQKQSHLVVMPETYTFVQVQNRVSTYHVVCLLIANVCLLVAYVCLRGRYILPMV